MSAIIAVAYGLVELDDSNFQRMRREIRREMRQHRLRLKQSFTSTYILEVKTKKGGHRQVTRLCNGSLEQCCRIAAKRIAPSNR